MRTRFDSSTNLYGSAWTEITQEYNAARRQLEQLLKEGGTLGTGAENLIINLDAHFNKLKHRVESGVPLSRSLTAPLPPPIDRSNLKGILAFRAWEMKVKGKLAPSIIMAEDAWVREVTFSDLVPSIHNNHGLHATRIEMWEKNRYSHYISGLVDLYGTVVEHADGVLRAECARIICIFITVTEDNQMVMLSTGTHEAMCYKYPNTPIHIVTPYQKKLMMWREVLITYGAV